MKCAIVDAYGSGRLLPDALRRHGVEYIHVRSEFPDAWMSYNPDDFLVDIAHEGDIGKTATELRSLGVDFVVAAADSGVLLADELSAVLRTPGNGMRTPEARRNKFKMQFAVRQAGLAGPDSFVSSSVGEILSWIRDGARWPAVLKPLSSAGADNVILCHSTDEVRLGARKIMASSDRYGRRNEAVLSQQYLAGDEYCVNSVSRRGVHRIVDAWRYTKQTANGRPLYDYEDLISLDDPAMRRVAEFALRVLDILEIRNGAGHTEVMMTGKGPFLIECAARPAGGVMPGLVSRCIGTSQVDSLAYAIAFPDEFISTPQSRYRSPVHLRCVNLISPGNGTMPPPGRWEPIRRLGSFADLVLSSPEGSRLSRTVDLATCPGFLYLASEDAALIHEDYQRLRQLETSGLYF
jgi:biotin carboxylase